MIALLKPESVSRTQHGSMYERVEMGVTKSSTVSARSDGNQAHAFVMRNGSTYDSSAKFDEKSATKAKTYHYKKDYKNCNCGGGVTVEAPDDPEPTYSPCGPLLFVLRWWYYWGSLSDTEKDEAAGRIGGGFEQWWEDWKEWKARHPDKDHKMIQGGPWTGGGVAWGGSSDDCTEESPFQAMFEAELRGSRLGAAGWAAAMTLGGGILSGHEQQTALPRGVRSIRRTFDGTGVQARELSVALPRVGDPSTASPGSEASPSTARRSE